MNLKPLALFAAFLFVPLASAADPAPHASVRFGKVAGIELGMPVASIPMCPPPGTPVALTCREAHTVISRWLFQVSDDVYELRLPANGFSQVKHAFIQANGLTPPLDPQEAGLDWDVLLNPGPAGSSVPFWHASSQERGLDDASDPRLVSAIVVTGDYPLQAEGFRRSLGDPSRRIKTKANTVLVWQDSEGDAVYVFEDTKGAWSPVTYLLGLDHWNRVSREQGRRQEEATAADLGIPAPAMP